MRDFVLKVNNALVSKEELEIFLREKAKQADYKTRKFKAIIEKETHLVYHKTEPYKPFRGYGTANPMPMGCVFDLSRYTVKIVISIRKLDTNISPGDHYREMLGIYLMTEKEVPNE